jgi:hypothetical protein
MNENLNGFATAPVGADRLRRVDEARAAVLCDDAGKWDCQVKRDALCFKDGALAFVRNGEEHRQRPTTWASGQLCSRLGIPAPYFRKCPPVLQDVQANYWLKETGNAREQWLLRSRHDTLRAVLSERYSPLDNSELLDALMPSLASHHRVDWLSLEEEGLHLRIVDPLRARDVLPDDALSVGIHISNSEVGLRSVTVDALVYRLVCTNGLIRLVKGKSLMRQRHVHIARPRLVAALEEAVAAAWGEAGGFLTQMQRTTQMPVEDVEGVIERLGERWHFSKPVQEDLLTSLRREPAMVQETVYGVVNAVTNVALRMSSEARYDLEVLAGHLAEQGVGAYAPKRPRRGSQGDPGAEDSSDDDSFDAAETARELFEAQVMSRRSLTLSQSEGVEI